MKKPKNNDNDIFWKELNGVTNYVSGAKVMNKKTKKRLIISIIVILLLGLVGVGSYFVSQAMQTVFNLNEFVEKLPEEEIVVDMNQTPIKVSKDCLRLNYFEKSTKEQVFGLMIANWWWQKFLSTDINKYEFSFISATGSSGINKELVQKDGFVKLKMNIKLKNSFFKFTLPLIVKIENNAMFYEKFMMFNHFESGYFKHLFGTDPTNPFVTEKMNQGYLPLYFHYDTTTTMDNPTVYSTIKTDIANFINDYSQEFAVNTQIFPILTTESLGDIDIGDATTFLPYLKLITDPTHNYINNVTKGANQYVNLQDYTISSPPNLNHFYITFFSQADIIDKIIAAHLTSPQQIIAFMKNNLPDYLPFSNVLVGQNAANQVVSYGQSHLLTQKVGNPSAPFFLKFTELAWYLANAPSLVNKIENINVSNFPNLGTLKSYLSNTYWEEIRTFLVNNSDYFQLIYPDPTDPNQNWQNVTRTVAGLQNYLVTAFNITLPELTIFDFLDNEHKIFPISDSEQINPDLITNMQFNVGLNILNIPNPGGYVPMPHSFSFFFKLAWSY